MLAEEMEAVNFLIPDTLNKPVDILRHIVTSLDLRVSKLLGLYRSENSADHSRNCRKRRTKLFETEAYWNISYLRWSSMGQERLNNLSIEHEVAHDLNYTDVIDSFAAAKARKVVLWIVTD